MIFSLILVFSAFIIALVGTKLLILAFRKKTLLVDMRSRAQPIPRAGGLAVMFALLIPMMVEETNYAVMLGMLLLASVSLLDDLIELPKFVLVIAQLFSVGIALSMMDIDFPTDLTPAFVDKLLIGLVWLGCINAFKTMDAMDGITAMEMVSLGVGLAMVAVFAGHFPDVLSIYSLILAAAGAGFFWWNRHPAKIFLGDVGAIPVGFIVGYILLVACYSGYGYAALILPAYYISESALTLGRKIAYRKKHFPHAYHKALQHGRKPSTVVRLIAGINVLLGFLAVYSVIEPDLAPICTALAYMAVFMLMGFFNHVSHAQDIGHETTA